MDDYEVVLARSARREIEALDASVVHRIFPRLEALATEPRPKDCRKIRGSQAIWRIRVGDYRIVYEVNDDARLVDIVAVRHRSKAYR
jgi:mRNA interferase RelE/StbE